MTEKLTINGKDVWINIEPVTAPNALADDAPAEYFMAFYHLLEPGTETGIMFREDDHRPVLFESPVAALAYANQKLLGML